MAASSRKIHPVILSGGAGTRLWPLSREVYPKQFFPLVSDLSLLQETAKRVADAKIFAPPLVVCNHEHRFVVREQLREIGLKPRDIVLEPLGRNTAAAAAVAALVLSAGTKSGDPLMLLMPCDHVISNRKAFAAAVKRAVPAAEAGAIVTFGIVPKHPETGYGYIQKGKPFAARGRKAPGCFRAARFKEKPGRASAKTMLKSGSWLWNSGMFLASAGTLLAEIERFAPKAAAACRKAVENAERDLEFLRLDAKEFAKAPSISLDYAVLEKTEHAAVVPAELGWSDIGSWQALWEAGKKDSAGNVLKGDVEVRGVHGCYIRSDDRLVAAIGLSDMTLIVTDDAVLAAPRGRAGEVKAMVEALRAKGRSEAAIHSRVYRPWGFFQAIDAGDRFQVKQITVNPGGRLSLQRHAKRAEHWVVVNGTARVTRGSESFLLHENESTFIPAGVAHRLENKGAAPLRIIEVQSGGYLGEDDIERLEDSYGRK